MKKITKMFRKMQSKLKQERGATMVEYVLMIVGIALLAVVGAKVLGGGLSTSFSNTAGHISVPAAQ